MATIKAYHFEWDLSNQSGLLVMEENGTGTLLNVQVSSAAEIAALELILQASGEISYDDTTKKLVGGSRSVGLGIKTTQ